MNITAKTARKHIKTNAAKVVGITNSNGIAYIIIDRLDLQRVDHVAAHTAPKLAAIAEKI